MNFPRTVIGVILAFVLAIAPVLAFAGAGRVATSMPMAQDCLSMGSAQDDAPAPMECGDMKCCVAFQSTLMILASRTAFVPPGLLDLDPTYAVSPLVARDLRPPFRPPLV